MEQKNHPTFSAQTGKLQTILRLDCRNVEPIAFRVKSVIHENFSEIKICKNLYF